MNATRVVKWRPTWNPGDFLSAVVAAGGLAPGSVVQLEYRHDEWCPRTATGRGCKCDPEVRAIIFPARPA